MSERTNSPVRELSIEGLAQSGHGSARWLHEGGRAQNVLVSGSWPGDRLRIRAERQGKALFGELLELLEPSAERTPAACADASVCGGCDWMHATRTAQQRAHGERLQRLFGQPAEWFASPSALGYRTRVRLQLQSHRGQLRLGFRERRSVRAFEPSRCVVAAEPLERARLALREALRQQPSALQGELSLVLSHDDAVFAELRIEHGEPSAALLGAFDALCPHTLRGLRLRLAGSGELKFGDVEVHVRGADGAPLELPPFGFAQANREVNALLGARVSDAIGALGLPADAKVIETHAGAGNFSALLARSFSNLHTYEVVESAVQCARRNLAARGLQAKAHALAVEHVQLPNRLRLLMLDPPREGARGLLAQAHAKRTEAILYVSCDSATLARDAAELGEHYTLERLEAFEMFPQTSHAEVLVLWRRRAT